MSMTVVLILCGGYGKRLRPLTDKTPKPMLKIGNKPILQYHIEAFKSAGIAKFILCTGYKHEIIENYFGDGSKFNVSIKYSREQTPLGTSGAIKLAAKNLNEQIVVVNGDVLYDLNPAEIINFHKSVKQKKPDLLATVFLVRMRSPYGIVKMEGDMITEFQEKPLLNEWLNAGIYVLEPELISTLPENGAIESLVFPKLAEQRKIAGYKYEGKWRDIGTIKDYEAAQKEFGQ